MMHKLCFLKVGWEAHWTHFVPQKSSAVRKIRGKKEKYSMQLFFSSILEKECYSLDRGEGCLLFTFLSLCSPSPRTAYKITFKWGLTLLFGIGFMALEQFCCFKDLLAVVCGAIADNLWWALWHHLLGSDGPTLRWKRAQKASDGLMKNAGSDHSYDTWAEFIPTQSRVAFVLTTGWISWMDQVIQSFPWVNQKSVNVFLN